MLRGTVEATIAVLFIVVVLGPIVAERLRIPGIVGLIAGGMLFGPFVLDWLEAGGLVEDLGSIGILYLMFLAGLSFDIKSFKDNRRPAIVYGLLGFFLPFLLSVFVVNRSDDIETLGALLIGAMWASNTLVAYSEVRSAGLQSTRSVGAAVSAGVVADLMSLTVLAFATTTAVIEIDPVDLPFGESIAELIVPEGVEASTPDPALSLWIGLPLLVIVCLWVLPKVAGWFFVRVGHSRTQRFVFTLALMSIGATFALMSGMEGLIGAFLAGLGLNRLVPSRGGLMERLDFVGTSIFIPVFLISIGLNIDPALLVDPSTIALGALFTGFVVVGKTAAAITTGVAFRYSVDEIGLMSALSIGQAASTLAIAQVGLSLGMFGENVVNAAVLAIVITAFLTSFATRYYAARIPPPVVDRLPIGEQVLLDARVDPEATGPLIAIAAEVAGADGGLVTPFGVTGDHARADVDVAVDRCVTAAAAIGLDADGVVRVDDSFTEATINLVAELGGSMLVLAWEGPRWAADYVLGNDIDSVGRACPIPMVAAHVVRPWTRLVVQLGHPRTSWQREDVELAGDLVRHLHDADHMPLVVLGAHDDLPTILADIQNVDVVASAADQAEFLGRLRPDDLFVAPAHIVHDMPPWRARRLASQVAGSNVAVVAGPHRLTLSRGAGGRPLSTMSPPITTLN